MKGKIYKLSSKHCPYIYIGSTTQNYLCQRLAGHAQSHREQKKDYKGIFDTKAKIELLEEIEYTDKIELLFCERKWLDIYKEKSEIHLVNERKVGLTPKEKKDDHYKYVSNYQASPAGQISLKKSGFNFKLKKLKESLELKDQNIKQLQNDSDDWKSAFQVKMIDLYKIETNLGCEIIDLHKKIKILEDKILDLAEEQRVLKLKN